MELRIGALAAAAEGLIATARRVRMWVRFGRSGAACGIELVNSHRLPHHAILLSAAAGLILAVVDAQNGRAHGQGKLDASYSVTLGGLPIGRGNWVIDIGDDHFSAAASGATAGLMQAFASGQGQSAVRGAVSGGRLLPANYASNITTDKKWDEVRMVISAGNVKDFTAEPPNTPNPTRVPLTDAHRRGVSDPMTAPLVKVSGSGDVVVPQACQPTLSIFDGRMRYDLALAFKRIEVVKSQAGYQGPVVVCAVRFSPIAGHVPDRYALTYLADLRDIEMWLAPIAGTRIMAPYRVSVPTPIGVGLLQATQFVSIARPGRTSAKAQ
jgi:hypothetical protein